MGMLDTPFTGILCALFTKILLPYLILLMNSLYILIKKLVGYNLVGVIIKFKKPGI